MPTKVVMPQMGESVAEGTVTRWLKKTGERVERDEPLFEITTDKVDAEIPSPASGVLTKILVAENETVAVNTVVAVIDGEGSAQTVPAEEVEAEEPAEPPRSSDHAEPSQPVETPHSTQASSSSAITAETGKVRSSPLVRRIAREHRVDLSRVKGTGLGGRISKKDILSFLEQKPASSAAPASEMRQPSVTSQPQTAASPAPAQITFTGPTHSVSMTPMRRQIAEHMVASKKTSAHVTTVFEVEMTRIVELRARMAEEFEQREGLKLTYTPFFARAAVESIKRFPIFNSSVEDANIVYKRSINLGIAVALETGLIVPVIERADEKNFLGIARAVQDLAERARSKRLSVDEVQGGTFTLTNPGVFGSLFGTPIINQPQVAILGVGTIEKRPVVRNDAIAIRSMAYLMLSFDHRIIDGAVADQFMAHLKSTLENWQEPVR